MPNPEKVLDYLADVAGFGSEPGISYGMLAHKWRLSLAETGKGILDATLTRDILATHAADYPHALPSSKALQVLVCLVSVCPGGDKAKEEPLLLLPGTLDAHGHLNTIPESRAYIPVERLTCDGVRNRSLCVCDLDAFRAHQVAMESLPDDGSWTTAVARAMDLFHAVSCITGEELERMGLVLEEDVCTIALCDHPALAMPTASTLRRASWQCVRSSEGISGPVRQMLEVGKPDDSTSDEAEDGEQPLEELPDDSLLDHKVLCGTVGHVPAMHESDTDVLATFAKQTRGDLMVVHAPAGTNGKVVALSAMAGLLTERALRGEPAPFMACVGTPRSLDSLLDLLADRPTYGQTALPSRWLPRIADGAPTFGPVRVGERATGRRVLGSLGALALAHTADGEVPFTQGNVLVEHVGQPADGDVARHRDTWYVPKATLHYLDCVSSFLGMRVRDIAEAEALLSEYLRRVDQERCELIDAYAEVCRAAEHMRQRDKIVSELGVLRREHTTHRNRLVYWESVAERNPPRRSLIARNATDQSKLIAKRRAPHEPLVEGCTLVEQVCAAYREKLESIESEIDRLRGTSATLSRRVRAASPEGQECSEIIARLISSCGLTNEQAERLESVMDGHDTSFAFLNAMLDDTVRPAEFWLAVHIYEARWLERSQVLENMDASMLACLCPFQLMSNSLAVGMLGTMCADDKPADLVVVLDSDAMGVGDGIALLDRAERALVMGSEDTLKPLPIFGTTSSVLHANASVGEKIAEELVGCGLHASLPATLFSVACKSRGCEQAWLYETDAIRVEIADVRSAFATTERMVSLIPVDDTDGISFEQTLPPLSHVLVPDSAWSQYGGSRQNRHEAQAVVRWIKNHAKELLELARADARDTALLVAPYEAQARLLRDLIDAQGDFARDIVRVQWLPLAAGQTSRVVLLCATCGPEALDENCAGGTRNVLAAASALARDALVMFCGGVWAKSTNTAAGSYMRRSLRVGRLFSVSRQDRARSEQKATDASDLQPVLDLRSKPLSLTALLARMAARGDIAQAPHTALVNKALESVGLIERVRVSKGHGGWRPTAAGREVGILATVDRNGNPFCSYTSATMAVIASIVDSMDLDDEDGEA